MEDLIRVKVFGDGRTEPTILSGTPVLLIQDGKVMIGRFCFEDDDPFSFHIDHPKNQDVLNGLALEIIREKKTEYLQSDSAVIVNCPDDLARQMIW